MLGPKRISERQAEGELENIFQDIKQTLRVSGISLVFRVWAGYKSALPEVWRSLRPNAETRVFESMADELRALAARLGASLGRLHAAEAAPLGPSQAYQLDAALDLYRYINPKLLLIASAAATAIEREAVGGAEAQAALERIERGIPVRMYPMEMVPERPDDRELRDLFEDIRRTLSLKWIGHEYRTLALWPMYLFVLWGRLAPFFTRPEYAEACARLREASRSLVDSLPLPFRLEKLRHGGERDEFLDTAREFERLLPGVILNLTLTCLDRRSLEQCLASPFPAAARTVAPVEAPA